MKKMNILMVGVVLALSASLALAGPWGRGGGMTPGYGMAPYSAPTPNLNAEQSAKLQAQRELQPLTDRLLMLGEQVPKYEAAFSREQCQGRRRGVFDIVILQPPAAAPYQMVSRPRLRQMLEIQIPGVQ